MVASTAAAEFDGGSSLYYLDKHSIQDAARLFVSNLDASSAAVV